MLFSNVYEHIARTLATTYGVSYDDILKAVSSAEKEVSVIVNEDMPKDIRLQGRLQGPLPVKPVEKCTWVTEKGSKCTKANIDNSVFCAFHSKKKSSDKPHQKSESRVTSPNSESGTTESNDDSSTTSTVCTSVSDKKEKNPVSKKKIPIKKQ